MWRAQRSRGRQRGGLDAYMLLMAWQLWQQLAALERKPPVCVALMAGKWAACSQHEEFGSSPQPPPSNRRQPLMPLLHAPQPPLLLLRLRSLRGPAL